MNLCAPSTPIRRPAHTPRPTIPQAMAILARMIQERGEQDPTTERLWLLFERLEQEQQKQDTRQQRLLQALGSFEELRNE